MNHQSLKRMLAPVKCHLDPFAYWSWVSALATFPSTKIISGLGLQDPYQECHTQAIVHAIKMLSSTDPVILSLARGQLSSVVRCCLHCNPTEAEIDAFLSGSMANGLKNHGRVRNGHTLWSCACLASQCLGIIFRHATSADPSISLPDNTSTVNNKVSSSFLYHHIQNLHAADLRSKPDQGKVACAIDQDKFATSALWIYDGTAIHFCDWRFFTEHEPTPYPQTPPKADGPPTIPPVADAMCPTNPKHSPISSATAIPTWCLSVPDMTRSSPASTELPTGAK